MGAAAPTGWCSPNRDCVSSHSGLVTTPESKQLKGWYFGPTFILASLQSGKKEGGRRQVMLLCSADADDRKRAQAQSKQKAASDCFCSQITGSLLGKDTGA